MGGVATAFIMPLRMVEHWAAGAGPRVLWWLVPTAPIAGAVLAGIVIHLIGARGAGPGVAAVMYAIQRNRSRIPAKTGVRKWLASTATIASGGSAGAEGPIVTIGATIGSNVGRWLRANPQNTATLLGCGAAAGISSVFNAPIAGIFFVLEILLRDFSLRTFTPIVIASVISAACTQAILGSNDALFAVRSDFFTEDFTAIEIPNYIMLGLVCGAAGAVFIRALYLAMDLFGRLRVHPIMRPVAGATLLGLLGLGCMWAAGAMPTGSPVLDPDSVPAFYGNGYPVIKSLLNRDFYMDPATGALWPAGWLLLSLVAIALLKPLATCLTIGSGGSGGMFAPSLLLGAAVGGAFGTIVKALGWAPAAIPAHYAVVGMAAMVSSVLRAPLTAILIVYEITRSYEIILPLMLAAVISTVVARLVSRESVYTEQLSRLGVRVGALSDLTLLRRLAVHDVPLERPVLVRPQESAQKLLDLAERHAASDFVVVDEGGRYVGMVTGSDLRAALVYREAIPLLQVHELQRTDLPVVAPSDTLDVVLERFSRYDVHALPVLDEAQGGRIMGLITRSLLMREYQLALSRD
jgi:CIC family chloride channel protein